eukprot:1142366-Pelagomonas_calceolata.AAC.5
MARPIHLLIGSVPAQVRLLLGEVPERAEFAVPGLSQPLQPYYEVTQAVRRGNLDAFAQVGQWCRGAGVCVCVCLSVCVCMRAHANAEECFCTIIMSLAAWFARGSCSCKHSVPWASSCWLVVCVMRCKVP